MIGKCKDCYYYDLCEIRRQCSHFYPVENPELRNKKAVTFVNPGSVGQPRNQNPCAQYAVLTLPSKRIELRATEYDVVAEQALFPEEIDTFYKERLTRGV